MGANFAPSYANLILGLWESRCIWVDNPFSTHLVFYSQYIDDIIIIWDGPPNSFKEFVNNCNANDFGL